MIAYPYIAYSKNVSPQPLIPALEGDPLVVAMTSRSPLLADLDVRDQAALQRRLEEAMRGKNGWGLAGYLENREYLLRFCPQMVAERRFYHLGLDIIAPLGTLLCAPLDAAVAHTGYEAGDGNYGGYVLLLHESPHFESFYSFYGHLKRTELPEKGRLLRAGEAFGRIGDFHENGNWFHHTHLQILTRRGLDEGYLLKGYCTAEDLRRITDLCPSPLPLFTI